MFDWVADIVGLTLDEAVAITTELDVLVWDLASFCNADPGDVEAAINSAMRGEVSCVRPFNVHLSAPDHLSPADRARFVHRGLMDQTTAAHGDFLRALAGQDPR